MPARRATGTGLGPEPGVSWHAAAGRAGSIVRGLLFVCRSWSVAGAGAEPRWGPGAGCGTGQRPAPHPRSAALRPCATPPMGAPFPSLSLKLFLFFQAGRFGSRAGGGGQTGAGWAVPVSPCHPARRSPPVGTQTPGQEPCVGTARCGEGAANGGRAGPCAGRARARGTPSTHGGLDGGCISLRVPWGPRLGFPPLGVGLGPCSQGRFARL